MVFIPATYNPQHTTHHTPDPGNAGVGRGNKLSVLRIHPDAEMV
jgi:hypothetical protein